jgi:hypothetical protein
MAPTTRTASQGIGKKPSTRKRPTRREPSDHWTFSLSAGKESQAIQSIEPPDDQSPVDNVEDAVEPLRTMAERVGKEVETFAETLDAFLTDLSTIEEQNRFGRVTELVKDFSDIASENARFKNKYHHLGGQAALQETNEQRAWQQEADIWELFHLMLELHPLDTETRNHAIDGSSPDAQLWDRFLAENEVALERAKVKQWLETVAEHSQSDLPSPKVDFDTERAMWVGCWEMLRRGASLQEISDWCEKQKHGWLAMMCLGGAMEHSGSDAALFRNTCRMAANSAKSSDYEAAVFGLLGGDVDSVKKVCRTVDDHLYAYYNAALLKQFVDYILVQEASGNGQLQVGNGNPQEAEEAQEAIEDMIIQLRKGAATSTEAVQPMKVIQGYLLADQVGSLVHTVGTALSSETAALGGQEDIIYLGDRATRTAPGMEPEKEVALNYQTLRIVTHMSIIFRALSPSHLQELEGDYLLEDDNVIAAYIQALRSAGKRDAIPIYASRLQRERYIIVLARLLEDITDSHEQVRFLDLLGQYDLDVISILTEQLRRVFVYPLPGQGVDRPLQMLEPTSDIKLYPGHKIIVGFLSDETTEQDEAMVSCLRWFHHMRGGWKVMFEALSVAMRKCLCKSTLVYSFRVADG